MGYKHILDRLYCDHHQESRHSLTGEVTSSHWKKYAALTTVVREKDGSYNLSGSGFGNFVPGNSLRALKHFLPNARSRLLINEFNVNNRIRSAGFNVARKSGREIDFDCVKQILTVDLLQKHGVFNELKTVVVIGDGYGYMTALLRTILPEALIICVNLGRVLFFDVFYAEKNFPYEECSLNSIENDHRLIFWEAENCEALKSLSVDLFINIASMQEMDMAVIGNYFKLMRADTGGCGYFYCCNRVRKTLPDGTVISFDEYPWNRNDKIIFDELCPWYQRFPILFPPFWEFFDGSLKHKLVKLHKQSTTQQSA